MLLDNYIKVVGFDPSLRNWGIAKGVLSMDGKLDLTIIELSVVQPVLLTGKQVRQNSEDLEAAKQLCVAALEAAKGAQAIFVEVPVGSQNARASVSYGVCVGILGALRATGIPFFEVTANEVKLAGHGKKTATKQEMIDWAIKTHPEANWPMQTKKGITTVVAGSAEHMADATAAIHAGLACDSFKQMLPLLTRKQAA